MSSAVVELTDSPAAADDVGGVLAHLFGKGLLYSLVFLAQSAAAVVITPVITRLLGVAAYGEIASVTVIMVFVGTVAGLGLYLGVQRAYADFGASAAQHLTTLSYLVIAALTAIFLLTVGVWAPWVGGAEFEGSLRLGVANAGVVAAILTLTSMLRSQERVFPFAAVGLLQAVGAQIVGIVGLAAFGRRPEVYLLGLLIGSVASFLLGLLFLSPNLDPRAHRSHLKSTLAFSLPLVPHALAIILLNLGDRVIVQRDLGSTAVGRYQIAYNVGAGLLLLLSALNQAWEPRLMHVTDMKVLPNLLAKVSERVTYALAPALVMLAALCPIALEILAPASYHVSGLLHITLIVAASCLPYSWYLANLRRLIGVRQTGALVWVAPVAAAANLALNVVLVPRYGLLGSALATLAAFGLLAGLTAFAAAGVSRAAGRRAGIYGAEIVAAVGLAGFAALPRFGSVWLSLRILVAIGCGLVLVAQFGGGESTGRHERVSGRHRRL
jgi:O-antigen/teichoic acid export membrane protein